VLFELGMVSQRSKQKNRRSRFEEDGFLEEMSENSQALTSRKTAKAPRHKGMSAARGGRVRQAVEHHEVVDSQSSARKLELEVQVGPLLTSPVLVSVTLIPD
jgi:hypothetical protein